MKPQQSSHCNLHTLFVESRLCRHSDTIRNHTSYSGTDHKFRAARVAPVVPVIRSRRRDFLGRGRVHLHRSEKGRLPAGIGS